MGKAKDEVLSRALEDLKKFQIIARLSLILDSAEQLADDTKELIGMLEENKNER